MQLEHILENDALIDELGFVHPTQLAALNAQSGVALSSDAIQSAAEIMSEGTVEGSIFYDGTVFWNRDHKLAISTTELPQLYKYKSSQNHDQSLQNDVLRHSKSLLLLCCDSGTAWNSRNHLGVYFFYLTFNYSDTIQEVGDFGNPSLSLLMSELQLSTLILSYSPKSENSWSHRRWVIKHIERVSGDLSDILGQESELVKRIAEKTKMNYRAWNHLCWLVSYMSRSQMLDELKFLRKWAELNVADNCCFQLRRRLMLKISEFKPENQCGDEGLLAKSEIYKIWEDEFRWNCLLIQRYIGREALWVHRRFLFQFWLNYLSTDPCLNPSNSRSCSAVLDVADFLQKELQLLLVCLSSPGDEFEDGRVQSEHASSYFFWILKHIPFGPLSGLWEKLRGVEELKALLRESSSPVKIHLWRSFLGRPIWDDLFGPT
ncbi:unnamed protein product [Spirodela intermedia]|uniref:Uncharacterized protein n=1 Tax=Spirodela intermedia TaxID=51605 RepID=A0A7I8JNL6_SPIIN|nr:unnamed protein product [Spirodela intermedia]CAA6671758.1 unnamed protein product [Spirodela intermedia]